MFKKHTDHAARIIVVEHPERDRRQYAGEVEKERRRNRFMKSISSAQP